MIQLTRLNSKGLIVNADLIKYVEQAPDTLVTLVTGEKIVVLEKPAEVLARIVAFRRSLLAGLSLTGDSLRHSMITESPESSGNEPKR